MNTRPTRIEHYWDQASRPLPKLLSTLVLDELRRHKSFRIQGWEEARQERGDFHGSNNGGMKNFECAKASVRASERDVRAVGHDDGGRVDGHYKGLEVEAVLREGEYAIERAEGDLIRPAARMSEGQLA